MGRRNKLLALLVESRCSSLFQVHVGFPRQLTRPENPRGKCLACKISLICLVPFIWPYCGMPRLISHRSFRKGIPLANQSSTDKIYGRILSVRPSRKRASWRACKGLFPGVSECLLTAVKKSNTIKSQRCQKRRCCTCTFSG